MTTQFKQDNPGCDCCGCTEPPGCSLSGSVVSGVLTLTWSISGVGITSAVLTNEEGYSNSLLPATSGTVVLSSSDCRQWLLTVINDCGTSTCTWNESNCTVLGPVVTDACTECADSNYPSSLITPRQVEISIADVVVGSTNTTDCKYYNATNAASPGPQYRSQLGVLSNPTCEVDVVADNPPFFNADFILDPCTTVNLWECRYKCSTEDYSSGVTKQDYLEYNSLHMSYLYDGGLNLWSVVVELNSHVVGTSSPTPGNGCSVITSGFGNQQTAAKRLIAPTTISNLYFWLSHWQKTMTFNFSPGTRPGKLYDPAYCDSECNSDTTLLRCLASGLTTNIPASTSSATWVCPKALDVTAATANITIL